MVDLFALQPESEHPHGLPDRDFDSLFTLDRPVIFNFHGYPWLIHRLAYRRTNHANIHVRGYKEKGNINTPLELAIQQPDRPLQHRHRRDRPGARGSAWRARTPRSGCGTGRSAACCTRTRTAIDPPDIAGWRWPGKDGASRMAESLEEELRRVEAEERELVLESFDNEDAIDLGLALVEKARARQAAGGHRRRALWAARVPRRHAGLGARQRPLDRAEEAAREPDLPELLLHRPEAPGRSSGPWPRSMYLDEKDYAPFGGCVPLVVRRVGFVGT